MNLLEKMLFSITCWSMRLVWYESKYDPRTFFKMHKNLQFFFVFVFNDMLNHKPLQYCFLLHKYFLSNFFSWKNLRIVIKFPQPNDKLCVGSFLHLFFLSFLFLSLYLWYSLQCPTIPGVASRNLLSKCMNHVALNEIV